MTEPLRNYSSSDVPEFSSYPAEPDRVTAEVAEFGAVSEFDALPQASQTGYDEQGRKIGYALGRLVNRITVRMGPVRSQMRDQFARVEDEVGMAKEAPKNTYKDV